MQNIIVVKKVVIPNSPAFQKGQKVRVGDELADMLVDRKLAIYDKAEPLKTKKAKKLKKAKEKLKEKIKGQKPKVVKGLKK